MTLGTGVGCALIHNGEIYYGSDPLGGILGGHISINKDGPKCICGNRGCLELYCSQTGLLRIFERTIPSILSNDDPIKSFFNIVRQGEMFYNKIFNAFINDLAIGLVNIIHTYSPEVIVLGGGIMKSADIILVLHEGRIVQLGCHEELLKDDKGIYRQIYELQLRPQEEAGASSFAREARR